MQTQPSSTQQDFAQWIKMFERQKKQLDQQIQQFDALQQELQSLVTQRDPSPKEAQKLEQVKELEQSPEYSQLRDRALNQIERLEEQFSQLVDWCDGPPTTTPSPPQSRPDTVAMTQATPGVKAKKAVRGFA